MLAHTESSTRRPKKHQPVETRSRAVARRVLVASDGLRPSAPAIRLARVMATEGAWAPEVITVREHLPVSVGDAMFPAPIIPMDPGAPDGMVETVRTQLRRLGCADWKLYSEIGSAPATIVSVARQTAADLIVLGLGRHGRLARLFGAETAARVCRTSPVPVLAVDARASRRPAAIIVAMDFGPSALRAADVALELLEPGGQLHLVHVRWGIDGHTLRDDAWERTYAMGVEQALRRLVPRLKRRGHRVTWELRIGGVLESLLNAARETDADIIAAGSHSQNVVDRLLLGSTPAHLLRAARCSVLIAPPVES